MGGDARADLAAAVIFAIGDHRPAVVFAGGNQVDFIAALCAVLARPQAALRIQHHALDIAVAVAPDFAACAALLHKRIIGGHAAVTAQAHDFADVAAQILRLFAAAASVAHAQINISGRQRNAATEMAVAAHFRRLAEQGFHLRKAAALGRQYALGQGGAVAAAARLAEAEIHAAVVGKVFIQCYIKQTALPADIDFRQACHRCGNPTLRIHHAQIAAALAD